MMVASAAGQRDRNHLVVGSGYRHGSLALSTDYQHLIDEKNPLTLRGAIGVHGEHTVGLGYVRLADRNERCGLPRRSGPSLRFLLPRRPILFPPEIAEAAGAFFDPRAS